MDFRVKRLRWVFDDGVSLAWQVGGSKAYLLVARPDRRRKRDLAHLLWLYAGMLARRGKIRAKRFAADARSQK